MKAPQSLAELVDAALAYRQVQSVRRLAQLAQAHDLKLTYTTLHQMRSGKYKSTPRADTLKGLAWLAGVPTEVAFTAAGLPVPGPPIADELPDGADHLSAKSKRALIEMARVLVDLEGVRHGTHTDTTPEDPGEREAADGAGSGAAQTAVVDEELPTQFQDLADAAMSGRPFSPLDETRDQDPYVQQARAAVVAWLGDNPRPAALRWVSAEHLGRVVDEIVEDYMLDWRYDDQEKLVECVRLHLLQLSRSRGLRTEIESASADVLPPISQYDLAAHPPMRMARDRWDETFSSAGEENQDPGSEG